MQIYPPIINIFEKAARKAGRSLIRDFGEMENLQIQSKSLGNFVTNADLKAESTLLETLQNYYPESTYLSEEKGFKKGNNETIVIDPIDGTSNFIHGIPLIGIVISRIINKEITDGIVYNPITNDFFWASKGKGAWHNNKRLRVSKRQNLEDCIIGTAIHHDRISENYLKEIKNIALSTSGTRRLGSVAIDLAYVAAGKLDAFWGRKFNLWDLASGVLLIKEAGGQVSEPDGKTWNIESKDILASNSLIHQLIQDQLI